MPEQIQKKPAQRDRHTDAQEAEELAKEDTDKADARAKRLEDLDNLLDEIDEVLEENAEDFVKAYRQKGGQ